MTHLIQKWHRMPGAYLLTGILFVVLILLSVWGALLLLGFALEPLSVLVQSLTGFNIFPPRLEIGEAPLVVAGFFLLTVLLSVAVLLFGLFVFSYAAYLILTPKIESLGLFVLSKLHRT